MPVEVNVHTKKEEEKERHFLTVTENAENGEVFVLFTVCVCFTKINTRRRETLPLRMAREGEKNPFGNMKHAVFVLF